MQLELKALQARTGTTFVYVTHDQEEAMTMSDRIAVMNLGVVEQLATPRELYQRLASAFVAGFIGTSNLIGLRVDRPEDGLIFMDLGGRSVPRARPRNRRAAAQITVRPESIKLASGEVGPRGARLGDRRRRSLYGLRYPAPRRPADRRAALGAPAERRGSRGGARAGVPVVLHWTAEHSFVIGSGATGAPVRDGAEEVRFEHEEEGRLR